MRYPRGCEAELDFSDYKGDYSVVGSGKTAIVTYGRLFSEAMSAQTELKDVAVVKLNKIYPLSDELIKTVSEFERLYFFEETEKSGGIGECMGARLLENGYKGEYKIHAIDNRFVPHAKPYESLERCGLDGKSMIKRIGEVK